MKKEKEILDVWRIINKLKIPSCSVRVDDETSNPLNEEPIQHIEVNYPIFELGDLKPEQFRLLCGFITVGDDFKVSFFTDHLKIDTTKPVYVYVTYPFTVSLEITIPPVSMVFPNGYEYNLNELGYYLYQIGKGYREIYLEKEEEAGIWGHGIGDLQLVRLNIFNNNKIGVSVSS